MPSAANDTDFRRVLYGMMGLKVRIASRGDVCRRQGSCRGCGGVVGLICFGAGIWRSECESDGPRVPIG